MYRYRYNGNSNNVLPRAQKHLHKVGRILSIRGYRYIGRYGATWEAVMVKGDKGSARFHGCCWGYGGEGPRTVKALLLSIGVQERTATMMAFQARRLDVVGTDWEIRWDDVNIIKTWQPNGQVAA